MKKLMYKKYNPCIFQGEKQLSNYDDYFEGWYFKNTSLNNTVCFIPGISINNNVAKSFIQVITNNYSYNVQYSISDFNYNANPFEIRIGNNVFTQEYIHISIHTQNLSIKGDLQYNNLTSIKTSKLSPNIMGPFAFVPNMECNHAIVSMKHTISGYINLNHVNLDFTNGIGYIEKDWGNSFPSQYIWGQGNCFCKQKNSSLFFSVATIPYSFINFTGFICNFVFENQEYRFATYNGSKLICKEICPTSCVIDFQKNNLLLELICTSGMSHPLKSPKQGNMKNQIHESIDSIIQVSFIKNGIKVFEDTSFCAGLEIVV